MSTGLIALLDDVVALSKMAAASLDDVAAQAAKAGGKAAGIVIDDAAVTPRYVVGMAAARELPVIRRIAIGSLKNKLVFLLPGALLLSYAAPGIITPLLMAGGAFLSLEGFHKLAEFIRPHHVAPTTATLLTNRPFEEIENERVNGAIRTDLILSAEIMAITLAGVAGNSIWIQGATMALVGVAMTVLVYGAVGMIVKADDVGLSMAQSSSTVVSATGRAVVSGMPFFLKLLSTVGMLAMLWVGGGIIIHGLAQMGQPWLEEIVHHAAVTIAALIPFASGLVAWLAQATISGLIGTLIGAVCAAIASRFTR